MSKSIVIDLDGTLTVLGSAECYEDVEPQQDVVNKLKEYSDSGARIIIYTARNMRTYSNSVGEITAHTVPVILDWLKKHDIPFDELHVGKPWCGKDGFYVDDKAIRPSEFKNMSEAEIQSMLQKERDL